MYHVLKAKGVSYSMLYHRLFGYARLIYDENWIDMTVLKSSGKSSLITALIVKTCFDKRYKAMKLVVDSQTDRIDKTAAVRGRNLARNYTYYVITSIS